MIFKILMVVTSKSAVDQNVVLSQDRSINISSLLEYGAEFHGYHHNV
jgi:hypothetical protein